MFTIEEISRLPLDPFEALAEFEPMLLGRTIRSNSYDTNSWDAESDYLLHLRQLCGRIGLDDVALAADVDLEEVDDPAASLRYVRRLVKEKNLSTIYAAGLKRRASPLAIGFSPDTRSVIHTYIGQIRELIHKTELPIRKKEAILKRLNEVAQEVDTDRTRIEALSDLAVDLTDTADDIHRKLSPARKWLEKILRKVGEARDEQAQLQKPEELKRIEGPKDNDVTAAPEDDEVPF